MRQHQRPLPYTVMDFLFFFFFKDAWLGASTEVADESVVTSHGSPQIVPHGDAALKGIAPLSINRRGMGIGGVGEGG